MLSRIILASYKIFLEICIWIVLIGLTIAGFSFGGFWAGIGALMAAFVFCVAVFGGFLVIADIQTSVAEIRNRNSSASMPR